MTRTPIISIFLVLIAESVLANPVNQWVEVPNTTGTAALDNTGSWQIKNIKHLGNTVVFESLSPEAEYTRVEGNCRDRTWRVLFLGQFNDKKEVDYQVVPSYLWHWHKPERRERKVLEYVCGGKG